MHKNTTTHKPLKHPNIWAVGDLQGCYKPLEQLLDHPDIKNDPDCKLWFAGDIINRGPDSLAVLKRIIKLGDKAVTVLGNHDLHLLAVYANIRSQNKSDTLDDILHSKNVDSYIDWLRHRPLVHFEADHLMVHAGVLAQWDVNKTLALANEVETTLRSDNWREKLAKMYGNEPNQWDEKLTGSKRRRIIINALTRMRMCHPDGSLEFSAKGTPQSSRGTLVPWFEVPHRRTSRTTIIFGHWSTLGLLMRRHLLALDTGYIWGGALSAVHLGNRRLIQIPAK